MKESDKLAFTRTSLALDRTFLAFVRTGLSFVMAGLALIHYFSNTTDFHHKLGYLFVIIGVWLLFKAVRSNVVHRREISAEIKSLEDKG